MKLKFIKFLFLFGVKAVLSACPNVNFGFNTGGKSFQIIIYENGIFARDGLLANQTESIPKSVVDSEFLFLLQTFLVKYFSSSYRNNPNG